MGKKKNESLTLSNHKNLSYQQKMSKKKIKKGKEKRYSYNGQEKVNTQKKKNDREMVVTK